MCDNGNAASQLMFVKLTPCATPHNILRVLAAQPFRIVSIFSDSSKRQVGDAKPYLALGVVAGSFDA